MGIPASGALSQYRDKSNVNSHEQEEHEETKEHEGNRDAGWSGIFVLVLPVLTFARQLAPVAHVAGVQLMHPQVPLATYGFAHGIGLLVCFGSKPAPDTDAGERRH